MASVADGLVKSLGGGRSRMGQGEAAESGAVGRIARVYEVARNALEYRADHLVRRAAIERMLRRQLVFTADPGKLADELLLELRWARYVGEAEKKALTREVLAEMLRKYIEVLGEKAALRDWLIGVASAEVEEKLNPNRDYLQFTTWAFHVMKKRLKVPDIPYLDLVLFVSVDRVYSQSDDQQVGYHLWKLIQHQAGEGKDYAALFEETHRHFRLAKNHKLQNSLATFVRQQMPPLVLVRDMYFADPRRFTDSYTRREEFAGFAKEVLESQLAQMRKRMNTATVRSLTYVFLTKMLLGIVVEIPLERVFKGEIAGWPLAVNLLFPVALMWMLSAGIRLPGEKEQTHLVEAAGWVMDDNDEEDEEEMYWGPRPVSRVRLGLYYAMYMALFLGIFWGLGWGLSRIGFSVFNMVIFIFFLCVVSFFAYRIRQTALVYTFKPKQARRSSLAEVVALPVVVVGSVLSREVSRLNFLVFIFDFVLEAPFKLILRFLDSWMTFLSVKRDEAMG